MKYKYQLITIIFLLSLASSLILSFIPTPVVCDPGQGCDVVQTSNYAYTMGIKNSYFGIAIFTLLTLLTISHMKQKHQIKKHLIHLGILLGSLISLYFIYLQEFVLKAWCKYCLIVDISLLIGLIIIAFTWKK